MYGAKFCSPDCYNISRPLDPDKRRRAIAAHIAKRRAIAAKAPLVENVRVERLAERDKNTCHLCGERVDLSIRFPDKQSPTVDHLVPIGLGGEHTYANTSLAHLGCNLAKGTKAVGEQLRLVG